MPLTSWRPSAEPQGPPRQPAVPAPPTVASRPCLTPFPLGPGPPTAETDTLSLAKAKRTFYLFPLFFFFFFLAALGLRGCVRSFSSCGERGLLFVGGARAQQL